MNKSKQISVGAIITVISILLMYMTSIMPTSRIFLVSLTSFLISILVIEVGSRMAFISFIATSILSFLIIPNKLLLIPYVVFLGYYGVLKSYIESLHKLVLEWTIKLIVFNIALYLNYVLYMNIFAQEINLPFSIGIVFLILQIIFIVYDYMFSMFIQYYNLKLRKYIR